MSSENILLDAPEYESSEVTLLDAKEAASGEFDALIEHGNGCLKEQNFTKAAEYFEKARKADITRENEVLDGLAKAYLGCEDEIRAIYWLEAAAEEHGMEAYKHDIMELYRTGVAGSELKAEAEEYFEALAKAEEERRKAEYQKYLSKYFGPEKVDYPQSFIDKMKELLEFERTYVFKLRDFDRDEKNAKESQAKKIRSERDALNKKYQELLEACKKEKENCHADQDFFFEYPLLKGTRFTCLDNFRKKGGYSLYAYANEEAHQFYLAKQGYEIYKDYMHASMAGSDQYIHVASTEIGGELDFFFFDESNGTGLVKDKEYDTSNAMFCKSEYYRWNLTAKLGYLKKFLVNNDKFVTLYCDWEYLKANAGETYSITYLWDADYVVVKDYSDDVDPLTGLENYYTASKDLTDLNLPIGEGRRFKDIKEYMIEWGYNDQSECTDDCHFDSRYLKKAVLYLHNDKIVAIIIPKRASDVVKVHAQKRMVGYSGKVPKKYYNKVFSVRKEPGANWEFFVATTMDSLAFKFGHRLPPFDVTERKPEGLPNDLWRLWVRFRYASYADKKK